MEIEHGTGIMESGIAGLQGIYNYFHHYVPPNEVRKEVPTVSVDLQGLYLGLHARQQEFDTRIFLHTNNLPVNLIQTGESTGLLDQLKRRKKETGKKSLTATRTLIRYLEAGGRCSFDEPDHALLSKYIRSGFPLLAGIDRNVLYSAGKAGHEENNFTDTTDASAHYVVLSEMNEDTVSINDPNSGCPYSGGGRFTLPVEDVIRAIQGASSHLYVRMLMISPGNCG